MAKLKCRTEMPLSFPELLGRIVDSLLSEQLEIIGAVNGPVNQHLDVPTILGAELIREGCRHV